MGTLDREATRAPAERVGQGATQAQEVPAALLAPGESAGRVGLTPARDRARTPHFSASMPTAWDTSSAKTRTRRTGSRQTHPVVERVADAPPDIVVGLPREARRTTASKTASRRTQAPAEPEGQAALAGAVATRGRARHRSQALATKPRSAGVLRTRPAYRCRLPVRRAASMRGPGSRTSPVLPSEIAPPAWAAPPEPAARSAPPAPSAPAAIGRARSF